MSNEKLKQYNNYDDDEDDDDEDYMSDNLIKKLDDVRPSLVSRSLARKYIIEKKHDITSNDKNKVKNLPIKIKEEQLRNQALSKSIIDKNDGDNKGLSIMRKMGFKIGNSLGRTGTSGLIEPINITLKTNRHGFGCDKHKLEDDQINPKCKTIKKDLIDENEYLNNKKNEFKSKKMRNILVKLKRICYQFDINNNVTQPFKEWYWPIDNIKNKTDGDHNDDGENIVNNNDYEFNDTGDLDYKNKSQLIIEHLNELLIYLRDKYLYCVWCGNKYNDSNDLNNNCPGLTEDDHDND